MNAVEQRNHKRAVDQVRSDVETVISAFVSDTAKDFRDHRAYVDASDSQLADMINEEIRARESFVGRPFALRMRWLFLGR